MRVQDNNHMDRETLLDMIPAYALGILDADETGQVEALLKQDTDAQHLLADYQQINAGIGLAMALHDPPAHLEDKLRARLKPEQQQKRVLRPNFRLFTSIAAVLMVVFIGGLMVFLATQQDTEALYQQLLSAPDSNQIDLIPDDDRPIEGQLVFLENDATAILRVANLPPLEEGTIYQIWMVDAEGSSNGGTYQRPDATGFIAVPVTKPVSEYVRFGMTIEPAPGSPFGNRPSGTRIFNIPVNTS